MSIASRAVAFLDGLPRKHIAIGVPKVPPRPCTNCTAGLLLSQCNIFDGVGRDAPALDQVQAAGAAMSLTDRLVPTYRHMLQTLSGRIDKAVEQRPGADAEALLTARLAPDMLPLSSQLRFAAYQAQEATFRLRGQPVPAWLEEVAREGREAGKNPGSIGDARVRINQALSFLMALEPNALDVGVDQPIVLELPGGLIFDMTGEDYVWDWALPQFYFHVVTAYAILRSQGIPIGKADYVPHMFGYLRTDTSTQS